MVDSPADFDRLESRLRLRGTLTLQTALHIGAGKETEGVDLPVLRDAAGFPFVPGASLKGVLRSTIEALVRAVDGGLAKGIWTCNPLEDRRGEQHVACGVHGDEGRGGVDLTAHCAVCRLFGSRLVASHVRFSDASMTGRQHGPPIELRDGVSIDRDLKVAAPGRKYDFEVVAPGTSFALEVFVENPRDGLMGLLMIGFDQIAEGFTALGGFTSRGLGRATLVWNDAMRFRALYLLEGRPPEQLSLADLARLQDVWRDGLATKVRA